MRVKLKTRSGQFWDRRLRWGITAGEVKDLPEPLPQDTLTYQKLRMGGFEIVKDDVGRAVPDVWDAPVIEITDISVGKPDVIPSEEGIHNGSPIESGMTDGSADTPVPPAPKPATKKRGRPKKSK